MPQEIYLLDATVTENIAFGISRDQTNRTALREAAKAAQILEFIESELPASWDTVVGSEECDFREGNASGLAWPARFTIARRFLFLMRRQARWTHRNRGDERHPRLQGTMTMIVIAHRLSTLERCDRIVRLESGKIIAEPLKTEILEVESRKQTSH